LNIVQSVAVMRRRAAFIVGTAVLLAGCGVDSSSFHRASRAEVKRLQANSVQAVYFAGMSFGGLPVTDVVGEGRNYELVAYGTCSSSGFESSCAPPIETSESPFKVSQWRRAYGCHRLASIRGVPTLRHDALVLVTGREIIEIYARSPAEDKRVARALRRVDGEPTGPRLPTPPAAAFRSLVERLCPSR
jgi:hypothetical protein